MIFQEALSGFCQNPKSEVSTASHIFVDTGKAARMVFTGLHDVQSACASQRELDMPVQSACWHGSPLQGAVTVCTDQGKEGFQRPLSIPLTVPVEIRAQGNCCGSLGTRERGGPGAGLQQTAWSTVRETAATVWGSRWVETAEGPGGCGPVPRKSLPGWPTTSYPGPPPDRCRTHVRSGRQNPPVTGPLLQLLRTLAPYLTGQRSNTLNRLSFCPSF